MLMAVCVMTSVSCTDHEEDDSLNEPVDKLDKVDRILFRAENPSIEGDARTELDFNKDGSFTPYWSASDTLTLMAQTQSMPLYRVDKDNNPQKTRTVDFFTTADNLRRLRYQEYWFVAGMTDAMGRNQRSGNWYGDQKAAIFSNSASRILFEEDDNIIPCDIVVTRSIPIIDEVVPVLPVELKFRRLSAMVRLNLINASKDRSLTEEVPIKWIDFRAKTHPKGGNYVKTMGGTVRYDPVLDEWHKKGISRDHYRIHLEDPIKNLKSKHKIQPVNPEGVYDDPMYFSTVPDTIFAQTTLIIAFETKNGIHIFKKFQTKEDIILEPGQVTTLNVFLKDEDIAFRPNEYAEHDPNPAIDPIVEGHTITMRPGHPDRLSSRILLQAMADGATVKIKGDANINLFSALFMILTDRTHCDARNMKLDLSEVNLKAADDIFFDDRTGRRVIALEDDYMPRGCMYCDWLDTPDEQDRKNIFTSIILPKSLKKADKYAIHNKGINEITIGPEARELARFAFKIGYDFDHRTTTMTLLAPKRPETDYGYTFVESNGPIHMIVHHSWKDDIGEYGWHGTQHEDVFLCDEEGNILEQWFWPGEPGQLEK